MQADIQNIVNMHEGSTSGINSYWREVCMCGVVVGDRCLHLKVCGHIFPSIRSNDTLASPIISTVYIMKLVHNSEQKYMYAVVVYMFNLS